MVNALFSSIPSSASCCQRHVSVLLNSVPCVHQAIMKTVTVTLWFVLITSLILLTIDEIEAGKKDDVVVVNNGQGKVMYDSKKKKKKIKLSSGCCKKKKKKCCHGGGGYW